MFATRIISRPSRNGAVSRSVAAAFNVQRNFMSSMPVHDAAEDESNFLLMLGKPGGGKGTISKKILKDFPQFHHISTGDILRQHVREETALGQEAKEFMDKGELVPDSLIIDLVMEDAAPYVEEGQSLLLDGFPRTLAQAKALDDVQQIGMVVNLDIPTDVIVERIADRWIHPASEEYTLTLTTLPRWRDWMTRPGSLLSREMMISQKVSVDDWMPTMISLPPWSNFTKIGEFSRPLQGPRATSSTLK